jgi:hypothetical protein
MGRSWRKAAIVLATLAAAVAAAVAAPTANAVSADCSTWTSGDRAFMYCYSVSWDAQVRVRGDCHWAPDVYSWWGSSVGLYATGGCLFSIQGAILELRSRY